MKLTAAKCPSCGANINVDSNRREVTCEFCRTQIIVDDAITRYKIEVLGNVEISNLPKLENYIVLAERYYNTKEFDEAYKQYSKIVELEPNNCIAVLRRGICDSLTSNYIKDGISQIINAFKESFYIIEKYGDLDKIDQICSESIKGIKLIQNYLVDIYEYEILSLKELLDIHLKLIECIQAYKFINHVSTNIEIKKQILREEIYLCDILIIKKKYKDGNQIRNLTTNNSFEKYTYDLRNDAVIKYNEIVGKKEFKKKNFLFVKYKSYIFQLVLFIIGIVLIILLSILT